MRDKKKISPLIINVFMNETPELKFVILFATLNVSAAVIQKTV